MAIILFGQAFQNFFSGRAKYPQFRKKGVHDRFTLTNDQFSLDGCRIRIPNIGRAYARVVAFTSAKNRKPRRGGVTALATLSTRETIDGPKPHKALLARLRRQSRSLRGSANRKKAKARLAKLHARIANICADALHQLTTNLTRRFHSIGIEDLNVRGMVKNHHLTRSIADIGFFEFRRQLVYKAEMRGGQIVVADRFFASSKMCSCCGYRLEALPLAVRKWTCPACSTHHDRDINAAINLKNMAVSSTVSACGEAGTGRALVSVVKPASVKQEADLVSYD